MGTTSQRTIIVNEDDDVNASVSTRGTKGVLAIEVLDASGTQIVDFSGGGTQYTEGDTDASITGTAILWEDTGDTLRAISAAYPLPVDITDSTLAVTQSGTWNINTITEVLGGTMTIQDGGGSITIDGTVAISSLTGGTVNAIQSGTWNVNQVSEVLDGTIVVLATDLDIRDLASASDSIAAVQSGTWNIGTITSVLDGTMKVGTISEVLSGTVAATQSGAWNIGTISEILAGTVTIQEPLTVDTTGTSGLEVVQNTASDLNVTEVNSGSIRTAVETIDNAISGSEMQVDIVAALPAGTNEIGVISNVLGGTIVTKKGDTNYTKVWKFMNVSTAQTDAILWNPPGTKFVLTDIMVSVGTAMTVHFEDGTTTIFKWDFAANGGCASNLQTAYQSTTANNNLTVTSTKATGNLYVTVTGYEV